MKFNEKTILKTVVYPYSKDIGFMVRSGYNTFDPESNIIFRSEKVAEFKVDETLSDSTVSEFGAYAILAEAYKCVTSDLWNVYAKEANTMIGKLWIESISRQQEITAYEYMDEVQKRYEAFCSIVWDLCFEQGLKNSEVVKKLAEIGIDVTISKLVSFKKDSKAMVKNKGTLPTSRKEDHKYIMVKTADGNRKRVEILPKAETVLSQWFKEYCAYCQIVDDSTLVSDLIQEACLSIMELVNIGLINEFHDLSGSTSFSFISTDLAFKVQILHKVRNREKITSDEWKKIRIIAHKAKNHEKTFSERKVTTSAKDSFRSYTYTKLNRLIRSERKISSKKSEIDFDFVPTSTFSKPESVISKIFKTEVIDYILKSMNIRPGAMDNYKFTLEHVFLYGERQADIARQLYLSEKSVSKYVERIRKFLCSDQFRTWLKESGIE